MRGRAPRGGASVRLIKAQREVYPLRWMERNNANERSAVPNQRPLKSCAGGSSGESTADDPVDGFGPFGGQRGQRTFTPLLYGG